MRRAGLLIRSLLRVATAGCLLLLTLSTTMGTENGAFAMPRSSPVRAGCDVSPRSTAEIQALIQVQQPSATPEIVPVTLPPSQPVDAITAKAIDDAVARLEACINANDPLRFYALFTNEALAEPMPPDVFAEFEADLAASAHKTPTPIAVGARQVLSRPWHVVTFPDGRVMAAVRFRFEGDTAPNSGTTKAVFFIKSGDRWLIQEMTDFVWSEDARLIPVEDYVGSPPAG